MSLSVGKMMRNLSKYGRFDTKDLQKAASSMLDGRGITRTEKERFVDTFKGLVANPSVKVDSKTRDAFDHLNDRMRGFSSSKEVFAPTLDSCEVRDIVSIYADQSRARSSSGRSHSSGGEGGVSSSPAPSRTYSSGGEGGGSVTVSRPSYSSYSGGE